MDSAYAALEAVQEMEVLIETIRFRNIRAEMDVPVKKQIDLLIRAETESLPVFQNNVAAIRRLCGVNRLEADTGIAGGDGR